MKAIGHFQPSKKNPNVLSVRTMVVSILLSLICGILLISVENAMVIASYVLAAILLAAGLYEAVLYFRSAPVVRITESRLAFALAIISAGLLLLINSDHSEGLLNVFWGLALLYGGFMKLQYSVDGHSLKMNRWWVILILAGISIVLGVLALVRPGFFGNSINLVIGIMMIVEAVMDGVVFFRLNHALKRQAVHAVPATPAAPAAESVSEPAAESVPEPAQSEAETAPLESEA